MMKKAGEQIFRYDTTGCWLKGNTHIHTTASDGGMTHAEVAALYERAGYDFLVATDHWEASDVGASRNPISSAQQGPARGDCEKPGLPAPLLWLDGVELDGCDETGVFYHVVCVGRLAGITREMGFPRALAAAREAGALLVLAHPHWTGNTLEDALRHGFDGVEIYNHVCHWLNGKSNGAVHWNAMLVRNPDTLAFAVDDAHLRPEHPGWNGGWIAVHAAERSPDAIVNAIRRGNYYASCGPSFVAIEYDGRRVRVETSPVQFVRLVGPAYEGQRVGGFDGRQLTRASMEVPGDWDYAYLEIEDEQRRRAWTNTLFTKQLERDS